MSPEDATKIVVHHLRERLTIVASLKVSMVESSDAVIPAIGANGYLSPGETPAGTRKPADEDVYALPPWPCYTKRRTFGCARTFCFELVDVSKSASRSASKPPKLRVNWSKNNSAESLVDLNKKRHYFQCVGDGLDS